MRFTYDRAARAIYVYLDDTIPTGAVDRTKQVEGQPGATVLADYDKSGRLLGVEILLAGGK